MSDIADADADADADIVLGGGFSYSRISHLSVNIKNGQNANFADFARTK